jgi:stage V sporulation protein R
MSNLIFKDSTWDFKSLQRVADEIDIIAHEEMDMNPFPAHLEIASADNILDVYAQSFPVIYTHWSFGKHHIQHSAPYKAGKAGLAYEVIIPGNPSLTYLNENNTSTMMGLTIAHAAIGHSHIFRNNYLFTTSSNIVGSIVDYLEFAKRFIKQCEDKYGIERVEAILDASHSLEGQSMQQPHSKRLNLKLEQERFKQRQQHADDTYNEIWNSVPKPNTAATADETILPEREHPGLPEYNLLYFLEKNSPVLLGWQREIVRIVRILSQYRFPSVQCSVVHESAAVYSHLFCMRRLHEKRLISDGAMLEVIDSTGGVTWQSPWNHWSGWNIYTLGIKIAQDIERVCTEPTDEDRRWFPDTAGNGKPMETLRYAWENFRDESFIRQYLSPTVIRDLRMFRLEDFKGSLYYKVTDIHDDVGYKKIRSALADEYLPERHVPDICVTDVTKDRVLKLTHYTKLGQALHPGDAVKVLNYIKSLWGYTVEMSEDIPFGIKVKGYIV